jgi:hypothetical protein
MGQAPALAEGETAPKALTNEELPTAAAEVATELEKIAAEARPSRAGGPHGRCPGGLLPHSGLIAVAGVFLGLGRCPLCSSTRAKFSFSDGSKLAYCTCNACNSQIFSRSDRSDELLRKNITPGDAPAPAPAPVAAAPAPAPAVEPAPVAPAVEEKPETKPAPSWGFLRA